ncbi:MAG: peroxide stress protein YaaA [Rheinheimera sp.]|uniref:peroxide stress protein YaaA n=1 Tax=Arsukibacterium sp. UBA3155 TaxID=1946058 RepID=UPI000C990446|nr:peroxide stress protein YaaA [Arsukibacterium sp. UBA3155]MAD75202.1 peroxide stress protein YaaA [Rheinheimera sp.]|tara:strand:+ start:9903 stop:10679 length:777 start_codon:yes stop_codon:yes gene_type:complete
MLMVVSPAKDLDANPVSLKLATTKPALLPQAAELATLCKQLSPAELSSLMHISDKLAGLNAARFSEWQPDYTENEAKAALFMFNGDVYQGLDAASLTTSQLEFSQQHLRILSGLYGVLRPLDLMLPYRLEMGTKLANGAGKDLYAFWQRQITDNLNSQLTELNTNVLLNLASQEYFKAVKPKALQAKVVTPIFKDYKNGQYKIISFFAKKARGLMARYVIQQQLTDAKAINDFNLGGYRYSRDDSTADKPVFLRQQPE